MQQDQADQANSSTAPSDTAGVSAQMPECVYAAMRDGHELSDLRNWTYVNSYVTSSLDIVMDDVSKPGPGPMEFAAARIERIKRLLAAHTAVRS